MYAIRSYYDLTTGAGRQMPGLGGNGNFGRGKGRFAEKGPSSSGGCFPKVNPLVLIGSGISLGISMERGFCFIINPNVA